MPFPLPLRPDPMPLREALRGLRHVLRRSGKALRDSVTPDALPPPAADIAGGVLREVEGLAQNVDEVTSDILKRVLGGGAAPGVTLRSLTSGDASAAVFGAAAYAALDRVLDRLGADGAFISEATARAAWTAEAPAMAGLSPEALAARLTLRLAAMRPLRGVPGDSAPRVAADALAPVAIFAVMLWLLSDRPEGEDAAAIEASADLAVALADDVIGAVAGGDADRLAALYAEFAAHV